MGLYDSIYIDVECPECGKSERRECQTKQLRSMMNSYEKGDKIGTTKYRYVECLASCKPCSEPGTTCHSCGTYKGGRSLTFHLRVYIDEYGAVTGEYDIR